MKKRSSWLRTNRGNVAHKEPHAWKCYYFLRSKEYYPTDIKPRGCRVCDECQRLEKLARKKS